jgi:hypothetical protein
MSSPPEHPGEPKWTSFQEWNKSKVPHAIVLEKSASETHADLLKRFGLSDESTENDGWGLAEGAQDQGWGAPPGQDTGGW